MHQTKGFGFPVKKLPMRTYRQLPKPIQPISRLTKISHKLPQIETQELSHSCSPKKSNYALPKTNSQFNICSSKAVFVFARKQFVAKQIKILPLRAIEKLGLIEEVFLPTNIRKRPIYRTLNRTTSSRRQRAEYGISPRKIATSQAYQRPINLNPEPWQPNREGNQLQHLF